MLISETKIDKSFPDSQFKIDVFSNPHSVALNEKGRGIMLLFREDLPVKVLSVNKGNESCYVEMTLKKTKWLINYSYNPTKNNKSSHLESFTRNLDLYISKFENILVIVWSEHFHFCKSCNLKILIKVPTLYKKPERQSCIDLPVTNKPKNFQNSCVIETWKDGYCFKNALSQTKTEGIILWKLHEIFKGTIYKFS